MSENVIVMFIVGAYMLLVVCIGLVANRWNTSSKSYMVAGESLGVILVGAILASEFVGLGSAIGTAETAFKFGIGASLNLITASVGFIFFAFFVAPKYREKQQDTVSYVIGEQYGSRNRRLSSILLIFAMLLINVGLYVGAASTIAPLLNLPRTETVLVVGLVGVIVVYVGGMFAVSWTNILDIMLIVVGIFVSMFVAVSHVGGFAELSHALPAKMFSFTNVGWEKILVWFVANVTAIVATQYIIQALASGRNAKVAKQSSLIAGVVLIPIALCAALVGMCAAVAAPHIPPAEAYGWFAIRTNPVLGGLMIVGLGAAMMGSLSAATHAATALALRDFYVGMYRPEATDKEKLKFARRANGLFALIPLALALYTPGILSVLFFGRGLRGTLGVIVLCALFAPKLLGDRAVSLSIILALVISSMWYLLGNPFGINNVFIAVGIPVLFLIFSLISKRVTSAPLIEHE